MQANGDFVIAQGADRFIQLNLAAVDFELLRIERVGDIARRHGTEQLIVFAGLAGDRDRSGAEQLRQILSFLL